MAGPYNIYLFDDCCHQWVSQNSGSTWVESATPNVAQDMWGNPPIGTLLDEWSDAQMAINDADYLTFVGFDLNYNTANQPAFGILGISKLAGTGLSWSLNDPEKSSTGIAPSPAFMPASNPSFGVDWQIAVSGAITGNASVILYCTNDSSASDKPYYPRISRNGGSTFSDVTSGLPGNQPWARAAFSANGTTMYLKPDNQSTSGGHPYKSTDTGATWTHLSTGPVYSTLAAGESAMRLRCSSNGLVVVAMANDGNFWLSTDGGATWTNTNFATVSTFPSANRYADCSVTPDGNTIIVSLEVVINSGFWPAVFISTNGGSSFTNISANLLYPASVGPPLGGAPGTHSTGCTACNVAPDGLGAVVTFDYKDNAHTEPDGLTGYTMYANVSTNSGAAFTLCSFDSDPFESGSALGAFTGIYIVPYTPIVPPSSGDDMITSVCVI